jgi:hypothetical protein
MRRKSSFVYIDKNDSLIIEQPTNDDNIKNGFYKMMNTEPGRIARYWVLSNHDYDILGMTDDEYDKMIIDEAIEIVNNQKARDKE